MKHFLSIATKYLSSIATISFLSTSVFASSAFAGQVVALKLLARPNGAPEQCLGVDISKIGVIQGAETAKVETCRNIQEMRFVKDDAGNGFFRYRVQNNSPSGQSQCLGVDGTKIGILPNAPWMRFEPCRNIQELQFRAINYHNGWFNLQLQSNLPYCAGVDGTKIGIIPGAQNLRAERCRGIQELYWQEVVLDVPQQPVQAPRQINMRPPVSSPVSPPNQGGQPITYNPPGTTPIPAVQTVISQAPSLYEYWIVARKINSNSGFWSPTSATEVGHAFNTLVKRDRERVQVYTGGALTQDYLREKGVWYRVATYSFWPGATNVVVNNSSDVSNTDALLRNESISQAGYAIRRSKVSDNRANWIQSNANEAGCNYYPWHALAVGPNVCNCVDYATRSWYIFSSRWEDFRPWAIDAKSPNALVDNLNSKNSDGGFLDKGNTWQ